VGDVKEIRLPDTVPLLPIIDPWSQQDPEGPDSTRVYEFYKNLSEGRLTVQRCKKCGKIFYPPQPACKHCYSTEYEWIDVPKVGEIFSFTAMLLGFPMVFETFAPFVIAIARFGNYPENGVQIAGMMFDVKYEELKIGDKVTWDILRIRGPGEKVRYWYYFKKL
jgi:uncharacterized OB-fold protein